MLAVQQAPRMGSSQPDSEPLLPFGYAVDPSHDTLFDAPPDPAPGAPLLTETDNKFLSCFFEDVSANQYDMPSFGEGLNFSDAWLDLPPQFMGAVTSFGPQSASIDSPADHSFSPPMTNGAIDKQLHLERMMPSSHLMPPPPPPPSQQQVYTQQHSDEVLNAAATLLQNSPSSRSVTLKNCDAAVSRRSVGYPVGHLRHQPMEEFKEENRRSSVGTENDSNFSAWVWGTKERTPQQQKTPLPDFQWGSDSSFDLAQAYAPEHTDSLDCLKKTQLKCLECLEVSHSATNTTPNSPKQHGVFDNECDDSIYVKTEDDVSGPPRKRRKSKNVRDTGDDDDDDVASARSSRKRKPRSERVDTSPASDTSPNGRRRKSVASGSKMPRENLSEEQKRENHIRSEQKRRTLIKEGFDDLGELVPGLKGGGFSKSTTLAMAAEWLEELLRGNKILSAQLAALERRM